MVTIKTLDDNVDALLSSYHKLGNMTPTIILTGDALRYYIVS